MSPAAIRPELAIAAGTQYLRRTADGGRWTAFTLFGRPSDEWVSAYIAATLAEAGVPRCEDLVTGALDALAGRQRPDGRFGYNTKSIGDADATLWALRLAGAAGDRAGTPVDRAAAGRALGRHVPAGGGVAAFTVDDAPLPAAVEVPGRPYAGWCAPHPCVSAVAAAVAPTADAAIDHLLEAQHADGSWPAYWWTDREYPAAHAAEALAARGDHRMAPVLERAAAWAASRIGDDGSVRTAAYPGGSPFATALALRAAVAGRAGADPAASGRIAAAVGWLCRSIRLDGSWLPSARLRMPHPHDRDPDRPGRSSWIPGGDSIGAVVVDRAAPFTTATVLAALVKATA